MNDIELINYVQDNPDTFESETQVTTDFIEVKLKSILHSRSVILSSSYRIGRSVLEKIINKVDKDFNLITDYGQFVFLFFRDGITREQLKERYDKERKERLKKDLNKKYIN
jgi:hypothetical protein